jgi:Na+-transporting methylmalonyl-CoA/oxaloacetate decarboxylase gamma subunit
MGVPSQFLLLLLLLLYTISQFNWPMTRKKNKKTNETLEAQQNVSFLYENVMSLPSVHIHR